MDHVTPKYYSYFITRAFLTHLHWQIIHRLGVFKLTVVHQFFDLGRQICFHSSDFPGWAFITNPFALAGLNHHVTHKMQEIPLANLILTVLNDIWSCTPFDCNWIGLNCTSIRFWEVIREVGVSKPDIIWCQKDISQERLVFVLFNPADDISVGISVLDNTICCTIDRHHSFLGRISGNDGT